MNDFSFSAVFRAAFNTFVKNFTDIFVLSVLSFSAVLFLSLFFNSVFLINVNSMMNNAVTGNAAQASNPLVYFSVYLGILLIFTLLFLFCMTSAFLPLCKGAGMKLKNYIPSFSSAVKFIFSMIILTAVFETVIVAVPVIAGMVSAGDGYTAGVFAVSVVSFAMIAALAVFALRYVLFFLPLLENSGLKEAFKKSKTLTNNRLVKIFILFAVLFIVNFLAKYFLFFLLFTVPFSVLSVIYAYLELSGAEIVKNTDIKN